MLSTFWNNYSEVTHLHGFHEMARVKSKWNRAYWSLSIVVGFVFALVLTVYGILNNLEDPVSTLVTINRDGTLDFPILYCPESWNWVDRQKLAQHNATEIELAYALSYLQGYGQTFQPLSYDAILKYLGGHNWDTDETDWITDAEIDLHFVIGALKAYIGNVSIPEKYSPFARTVFALMQAKQWDFIYAPGSDIFVHYIVKSNALKNIFVLILDMHLNNKHDQIFDVVYKYLPIGYMDNDLYGPYDFFVMPENIVTNTFNFLDDVGDIVNLLAQLLDGRKLDSNEEMYPELEKRLPQEPPGSPSQLARYTLTNDLDAIAWWNEMMSTVPQPSKPICFTMEVLEFAVSLHSNIRDGSKVLPELYQKVPELLTCADLFGSLKEATSSINQTVPGKRFWIERLLTLLFPGTGGQFDIHRSDGILAELRHDSNFSNYLTKNDHQIGTRQALANYLMEVGPNKTELTRMLRNADAKFIEKEEAQFMAFLKKGGFGTPLDFIKAVSIDLNRFLVWISYAQNQFLDPANATITGIKTWTELGLCIHISVKVPPRTVQIVAQMEQVQFGYRDLNRKACNCPKDRQKYYISILPVSEPISADDYIMRRQGPSRGTLSLGDAAYDLYPGMASLLEESDYRGSLGQPFSFQLPNLPPYVFPDIQWPSLPKAFYVRVKERETQQRKDRYGSRCGSDEKTTSGTRRYTYNNCVFNCHSIYKQPKLFVFEPNILAPKIPVRCQFGQLYNQQMTDCSYFAIVKALQKTSEEVIENTAEDLQQLRKCIESCLMPCYSEFMLVESGLDKETDFRAMDNPVVNLSRKFKQSLKKDSLVQVYSISEIDAYLRENNLTALTRVEIEIESKSITYREKETFTWDSMFGIVGGQIGLVTGASCLTVFQLVWVIIWSVLQRISQQRSYRVQGQYQPKISLHLFDNRGTVSNDRNVALSV